MTVEEILKGKEKGVVQIRGWVHNKRESGGILFLLVRDGTGIIQCTVEKKCKDFDKAEALTVESSLILKGLVKKDERAPGGYEVSVYSLSPIQIAEDYPIGKKKHGPDFLLSKRHLSIRTERMRRILRVRSKFLKIAREWFEKEGYTEFHAPIFTSAAVEGGATLFPVDYFGDKAYLTQSWQLYAEAGIASLGKIYTLAPSFRAEKSRTRRHLTEYWHLEAEIPFCDFEGLLKMEERFLVDVLKKLAEEAKDDILFFGRDVSYLKSLRKPFLRLEFSDVVKILEKKGIKIEPGEDLTWRHEQVLTKDYDSPFFVIYYPVGVKAFYHMLRPKDPKVTLSADLLAPEGYGEITGGGERIWDTKELIKRIKEEGLKEKDYSWYLDLRRYGTVPHSGFGLGVERTIAWILRLDHIRDAIPFPRMVRRRPYP